MPGTLGRWPWQTDSTKYYSQSIGEERRLLGQLWPDVTDVEGSKSSQGPVGFDMEKLCFQ